MDLSFRKKKRQLLTPGRTIILSFFFVILLGGFLLCLPISSNSGAFTPVEDAMFTATSATCVTGLAVYDTWQYWSVFGQIVILLLIQVGGLGLITFTTGVTLLFRQKLGLKSMYLMQQNSGIEHIDIFRLLKTILIFTFGTELLGTLILLLRFIPLTGPYGIWISVFTAVSAFCNGGFDIFSSIGDGVSTVTFAADPLVALPVTALIVLGGIGFVVVSDIYANKCLPTFSHQPRRRLSFHSRVTLMMTAILLFGGAIVICISEYQDALSQYNFFEKFLASLFESASSRTAGFSPIDPANQNDLTKVLCIALMFIGGSSTSTAGGVKTSTVFVLIAANLCVLRGQDHTHFWKRRISGETVRQAMALVFCGVIIVTVGCLILSASMPDATLIDCIYEVVSAFSTTGFNAPFTPYLPLFPKIVLILAMFIGRVGPVSLSLFFVNHKKRHSESILPDGNLLVG